MRLLCRLSIALLPLFCRAQPVKRAALEPILSFEAEHKGNSLGGWGGGPPVTISVDDKVFHGGKWAARLERNASSEGTYSIISISLPIDFSGTSIELRGFLKTEDVSGFAGLWMREDAESGVVAFDNMEKRGPRNTTSWTEYSITLPLKPEAKQFHFGVLTVGTGTAWADDLKLLVDGKLIWRAPAVVKPKTIQDTDHEFDGGSNVTATEFPKTQIGNLALLAKV